MNNADFTQLVEETFRQTQQLLRVKGGEYSDDQDRLANFGRAALLTGMPRLSVAFVYLSKHYDAISREVRDRAAGITREKSESLEGRIHDLINYCLLLKAIIREDDFAFDDDDDEEV